MHKYNITDGNKFGIIEINDDKLKYNLGKTFETKISYIQSVEKLQDMALSKSKVKINYYNLLGDVQNVEFIMAAHDLAGLKKVLEK